MLSESAKQNKQEYTRKWKAAHPEKLREYNLNWYYRNRDSVLTRMQNQRILNPDKENEYRRKRRPFNLEKLRKQCNEWITNHPDVRQANNSKRRARKLGNGGEFTPWQFEDLCYYYGYKCLCCGNSIILLELLGLKLVPDHVLPLIKGGTSNIDNIQPLCSLCNNIKHTKHIDYRE